ncbi:MAG: hypothetical protein Q4D79_14580 [Propionibacteriaceae bacterium]|nr:hypothetical protein [Propionibacteriaceae bacterium]
MTNHLLFLLESSSGGESRLALLGLGVIAAIAFYGYIWRRYRNTDKSYQFESTTQVELSEVTGSDSYSRTIQRTRDSRVAGYERTRDPRQRIRQG